MEGENTQTARRDHSRRHVQPQEYIGEPAQARSLDDPELYVNRELSLLAFQHRVLQEAQDESNPLLERVNFLAIVGSNLDEFFMVRVAGLKRRVESGGSEPTPDDMLPTQQLDAIRTEVTNLSGIAARCWQRKLNPALERAGVNVLPWKRLSQHQRGRAVSFFQDTVFPVLTPLAFDPDRPFPHISNLSLNLAVSIRDKNGEEHFARVKVPDTLPQLVSVDRALHSPTRRRPSRQNFIWLEDLIKANLDFLFPGMEIVEAFPFHVTRDADTAIQELEAGDLLETTEEGLRQRRFADVVRLQVDHDMPVSMLRILMSNLEVTRPEVYRFGRPLTRLKHVAALEIPELKYSPFVAGLPFALDSKGNPGGTDEENIFAAIQRHEVLLHHPFNSFKPTIGFLDEAAADPKVLAIKITLYRVGQKSPIVNALLEAAEAETQVAAVVELKARFDEGSNIEWARALEHRGVHVVYGLIGLKVHAKLAMVVRREGDQMRRYVHLGTGNYNPATARLYTDIALLTADEEIAADATDLFNYLTGYSDKQEYRKLLVAPINLRERFTALIEREIASHRSQGGGHLILKMNALVDRDMIRLLYRASQAGVKVDLLVRGVCCLRPGVPGVSENIRVTSIVGRFLEHSRIYYFRNNGEDEIYVGSADLMPRNLDRRVEVLFPIEDRRFVRYLREEVLAVYLCDNVKARVMQPDGTYVRKEPHGELPLNSQSALLSREPVRIGQRSGAERREHMRSMSAD
jgi:polyphosphate kinase